jgi:hypothetical protein
MVSKKRLNDLFTIQLKVTALITGLSPKEVVGKTLHPGKRQTTPAS